MGFSWFLAVLHCFSWFFLVHITGQIYLVACLRKSNFWPKSTHLLAKLCFEAIKSNVSCYKQPLKNYDTMETSVVENPKLVTHQQYVYQMKADIILNSNLTSDFMIVYCKSCVRATYRFFIHAKFLTSRLWRSPAAKPYKVSKKFLHEQMQEGST